jgi:hypothetical protein
MRSREHRPRPASPSVGWHPRRPRASAEGREALPSASARFSHDFSRIPLQADVPARLQAKLTMDTPGNRYEQEADRVAAQVTAAPVHSAPPRIQRFSGQESGQVELVPRSVAAALASPGRPLAPAVRQDMEERLGHDFSNVRVHSDATAEQSARELNARAYTLGRDIVIGAGRLKPETPEGRRLIAHELTHVVQQTEGRSHGVMRDAESQTPPGEEQEERVPFQGVSEWLRPILSDRNLSPGTKLRAMAMDIGFIEFEPKSEAEFVKDLESRQAEEPAAAEPGLSSEEAGKLLTELLIRRRAVDKAMSLMGADWHAPVGSAAYKTARSLHGGDPQDVRSEALSGGMLWAFNHQEALQERKEKALIRYSKTKSAKAREEAEAADGLLTAVSTSLNKSLDEQQYSPATGDFAGDAWRYLGSEKSKKYLEKVGFPLAWFTTCVTLVNPVAQAAGVDTKKWGPLDMFDKRRQERFNEAQKASAWVPAESKKQPEPGDILITVSYRKEKGVVSKEISKATFQHVAILVEPVTTNPDGSERWVTADGGKGSSHKGEDKTGTTIRRYNPVTQQFITENQTNLQEAAEGGRYLLGFWSIIRLPMQADAPAQAKKSR